MNTIGYPGDSPGVGVPNEMYGIFSSSSKEISGTVDATDALVWYKGSWYKLEDRKSPDIGFFITFS